MMPDDAATLARFDDFLDGLVDGGNADVDSLESGMVETVTLLRSATRTVSPDPVFAAGLRRSLLQRAKTAPVAATSSASLHVTLSPPATPFPTKRWWPRFELAAMVLVILAVAGSLANGGGYRLIGLRSGENEGRSVPGYSTGSPIASPIATTQTARASVAILFVADVSGSMTYDPLGGTPRIEMLKEALRQAAGALADGDEFGVLAFNDRQTWITPVTKLDGQATRDRIDAEINEMTAEGGTEILPALSQGFDAIGRSSAGTRHVILLSDGKSRTGTLEDYQAIVAAAVSNDVTLSTVAVGGDADTSLLTMLATAGHGRYHLATTSADIPAVTLQEVEFVTGPRQTTNESGLTPTPFPNVEPPTATVIPTVTPIDAEVIAVIPPTPAPGSAPSTRFAVGATVYVAQPRVALREGPSFEARTVTMPTQGTPLTIIGPSVEEQGVVWWPVGDPATGDAGFVVEDGLSEVGVTPTPTPAVDGGFIDPASKVDVAVTVDADGLIAGDPTAEADAAAQFRPVLAPYAGCRVGLAMTFGYSSDVTVGVGVADAVNALLKGAFPEMFGHAAMESFANLRDPIGQVEIDLYFYQGCVKQLPQSGDLSVTTATPTASTAGSPTADESSVAILFLIDKSGSMSYDPLGGTAKLEMEKETVRRAVAALPVGATIGVMAFNEWQEWAVPWTTIGAASSQADRNAIVAAVDAITAEGGSELPAALTAAFYHMRADVDATTRHIVLLSDGKWRGGSEQFYRQVVGGAVQEGFVLSTIAFGDDADTATMQLLAELGHGRYHHVVTPEDIPLLTIEDGSVVVEDGSATPAAGTGG